MTQSPDMTTFMAAAHRLTDDRSTDLPEAPLAMPDQDLTHVRGNLGWRRMRSEQLVRS